MRFCFLSLLVLCLIFVVSATKAHDFQGKSIAPVFKEGSFSIVLRDEVTSETIDQLMQHVQEVHASSVHEEKVGSISKKFERAFKVSALFCPSIYAHLFLCLQGFTLHGASNAMIEHIRQLPEVEGISPMRMYQANAYSWG